MQHAITKHSTMTDISEDSNATKDSGRYGRRTIGESVRRQLQRHRRWIKVGSIVVAAAAALAIVHQLPTDRAVQVISSWVQGLGAWGPVIFAMIYLVAVLLFIPGAALTLAAGAIFGLWWGTLTVSLASTTASMIAFLVARYLARRSVRRWAKGYPKFAAIDQAIGDQGWKIVALLRLSPAVPYSLSNYLYGLTGVRFGAYAVTSWLAMLPGTFLYVYLGYAGRAGIAAAAGANQGRGVWQWVMLAVGLAATVAVTVYVTRIARRAIAQQTQQIVSDDGQAGETHGASSPADHVEDKPTHWPWGTLAAMLVAAALVSLAACSYIKHDAINSLFGPPVVTLTEAYKPKPNGPTFSHAVFDQVLHQYVKPGGWVDYKDLSKHPQQLDAYIQSLGHAPFDQMGRNQKLALLLNAYNAFTLRLILDHYPIASIKDIPAPKRWADKRWNLGGHVWSLDDIEQRQIRGKFREPRVHFAMVCASIGCPPLRDQAYEASKLDQQLQAQAVYVHTHPQAMIREASGTIHTRWFRFDPGANVAYLTKLYDWYGGDFRQVAGSVLKFAARYSPPLRAAMKRGSKPSVEWVPYDWRLNSVANRDKFAK